ncbi:ATP-binding cassette domain-containing protein [Draconibacterium sp. IB214405]|uniref:ATP-binding cassette domain-containing protein n=1 Tax=Draconibacterium sp. IB214405 TaxID=3097352 RepID=UPI002A118003|nr:ATP-binding cassette domain-containing protein [Draconibacterium sp. IB214405]MDX8339872.1 ATP-binding cassette domain-containing protein [Draconibacterium sp. IB214405]
MLKHVALNGLDLAMDSAFIKRLLKGESSDYFPELAGKRGVLFSNTTLAQFIEDEFRHDNFELTKNYGRSIRTLSSGEQKKALLEFLLAKKPDFILLDNPFDALDVASVKQLKARLETIANEMTVIQVFKRKSDLLPFIDHAMRVDNGRVVYNGGVEEYLDKYEPEANVIFSLEIPGPIHEQTEVHEELIKLSDVSVHYQERQILNAVNWTINAGEFWQLKGPNGSGKTTILTMINGDNPKAFGQNIELFGRQKGTGESVWEIKKKIGYFTPSMMELFKRRHTAEQMVISGFHDSIGLYHRPSEIQTHVANEWLKVLGIEAKSKLAFVDLSQVHRRMVLIARAMIKHPPLLILDEPSTGLDDKSAALLSALINKIADESKTAILYVSHRTEPDLKPQLVYELKPGENGSVGAVKT